MTPFQDLDRLRGWILVALYAVMALFAPMLFYATIDLWPVLGGVEVGAGVLLASATLTTLSCLKSLKTYVTKLRTTSSLPPLEIAPFFFMVVSLAIASRLFADI